MAPAADSAAYAATLDSATWAMASVLEGLLDSTGVGDSTMNGPGDPTGWLPWTIGVAALCDTGAGKGPRLEPAVGSPTALKHA